MPAIARPVLPVALLLLGLLAAFGAARADAASVTINGGDPAPTRSTAAKTFSFTVTGTDVTVTCELDGAPVACTPSGATVPSGGSPSGTTHTFSVTATDPTGSATATRTWRVDTQPPAAPVLTVTPAEFGNVRPLHYELTAEDGATLECAQAFSIQFPPLDGEYSACASPVELNRADGQYRFGFRARDVVGPGPAVGHITTLDTAAPGVNLGYPSNLEALAQPRINFSSPEANVAFTCSLDGAEPAACTSPWTPGAALSGGDHTLAIKATDRATNAGEPNTLRWTYRPRTPAGGFDESGRPQVTIGTLPAGAPAASRYGPLISPFPIVRLAGVLMGDRSRIRLLTIRGPRAMTVRVSCRGRGCPRKSARIAQSRSRVARVRWLTGATLSRGAVITVRVSQRGRTGKYTKFVMRPGRAPRRTDACLLPGGSRPVPCPD